MPAKLALIFLSILQFTTNQLLQTNFESFLPIVYEKVLSTLFFIVISTCISLSYSSFDDQLEKLKILLMRSGYPVKILDHCFQMFLDKIFNLPGTILTVPKLSLSLILPFTGDHGLH